MIVIHSDLTSVNEQLQIQLDFFDQYLKGIEKGVANWPAIKYYNFGEEAFKESNVWPPAGQARVKYFFRDKGKLKTSASAKHKGMDEYLVDFSVTTGKNNRWATQMGNHVLNLNNRNAADSLMLTYTTKPLKKDIQITGTPAITLNLSSTHQNGGIIVYLEDVDENGMSRYITEGGLLLEHRKLSEHKMFEEVPYHSFNQSDATMPLPANN